jgi:hypothetical protein
VQERLVPAASAYNNVLQRASQAFGLAVLTALGRHRSP